MIKTLQTFFYILLILFVVKAIKADTIRPNVKSQLDEILSSQKLPQKKITSRIQPSKNWLQSEVLFSDSQIEVYKAYPNPANAQAYIDYIIKDPQTKARINIFDVLGNSIAEFVLTSETQKIRVGTYKYESGVYLYALSVNGKTVATKKLIVNHNE